MKTVLALCLLLLPLATYAQPHRPADDATMVLSGVMEHSDLEGGCWYLNSEGKHYELIGPAELLSSLKIEGKLVQLEVEPRKGVSSTCMMGPIVYVVREIVDRHPTDAAILPIEIEGTIHRWNGVWYVRTAKGLRYNFQTEPPKKYRKIRTHYKSIDRVMVVPGERTISGVILPAPTPAMHEPAHQSVPATQQSRAIQKPQPTAK